MEQYRIRNHSQLPRYFYRVMYAESRTHFWPFHGLVSESQDPVPEVQHLSIATVNNLQSKRHKECPFINVFPSYLRASAWANDRRNHQRGADNLLILTIDTRMLGETVVFRIRDVVSGLSLRDNVPKTALNDVDDGYMCLHQIPAAAIVDAKRVTDAKKTNFFLSSLKEAPGRLAEDRESGASSSLPTPPPSRKPAAELKHHNEEESAAVSEHHDEEEPASAEAESEDYTEDDMLDRLTYPLSASEDWTYLNEFFSGSEHEDWFTDLVDHNDDLEELCKKFPNSLRACKILMIAHLFKHYFESLKDMVTGKPSERDEVWKYLVDDVKFLLTTVHLDVDTETEFKWKPKAERFLRLAGEAGEFDEIRSMTIEERSRKVVEELHSTREHSVSCGSHIDEGVVAEDRTGREGHEGEEGDQPHKKRRRL